MGKLGVGLSDYIYHNSRSKSYRWPYGAVATSTSIDFCVDVYLPCEEVKLCYSYGLYEFNYCEMSLRTCLDNPFRYQTNLEMPLEPGLFFYWFMITPSKENYNQLQLDYIYNQENTCTRPFTFKYNLDLVGKLPWRMYYVYSPSIGDGSGRISDIPSRIGAKEERYPAAWQVTIYQADFKTPNWFKGAVMYQIFPDRFARGKDYQFEKMQQARQAEERLYHENWSSEVDIDGHPSTGYLACDFFGGTLSGITERVDYLKKLNVDLVYLNPIFSARSNHRYDTSDYFLLDPMLGDEKSFDSFAQTLEANHIKFILDGVFSHTGADSIYFNKLERYKELGAYQEAQQGKQSKYRSWYWFFKDSSGRLAYNSWWGFTDLPSVNENDLSYRQFIFGDKGVIKHWIDKGSKGFRLDVSDELPDSFLRQMRHTIKKSTAGEGIILGEIWEDATNKVSYGSYRDFIFGNTHDSVMAYTFRDAVLGFLTGVICAKELNNRLESFRENYPPQAYYCLMNLISSHDVPRAITVMAGPYDPNNRQEQIKLKLTSEQRNFGLNLMRLALVFQMGYIGNPCVYYGDEIGMEGYRDPFNRRTYPWDALDLGQKHQLAFYQKITGLRKDFPVLKVGFYHTLWASNDVIAFERYFDQEGKDFFGQRGEGNSRMVIAINRNEEFALHFSLHLEQAQLIFKPRSGSVGQVISGEEGQYANYFNNELVDGTDILKKQNDLAYYEEMANIWKIIYLADLKEHIIRLDPLSYVVLVFP